MSRIENTFKGLDRPALITFIMAGDPDAQTSLEVLKALPEAGADIIELGMPFTDPMADGPTIELAGGRALKAGASMNQTLQMVRNFREGNADTPIVLMGYFNPVLQYGVEAFCKKCQEIGIDGLILPDLPVDVYDAHYRSIFEAYGLINVFLITPQTSDERIRYIDSVSNGFIYMVSSASTTGAKTGFGNEQTEYFKRIADLNLTNPQIVGFGISNNETFTQATKYAKGAIIGSAFIKHLTNKGVNTINTFIKTIR